MGELLGVDGEAILASSHGVRSIETLALYDKSLANWECALFLRPKLVVATLCHRDQRKY